MGSLTQAQFDETRAALLGDDSDTLIDLIFRLNVRQPAHDAGAVGVATELGWVAGTPARLTPLGSFVADPIREYRFWVDRDRRINSEDEYDLLAPSNYEGKSVLEPGSGFGCNLFALSRVKGRFVGLEPVELYRQMTSILAAREGLPEPEVVGGSCEALPFADGEFDFVVCYGSHQYMEIPLAIGEMARVLKPGGQLRVIGETLGGFVTKRARNMVKSPRAVKHYALTITNTLAFELTGARLWTPRGDAPTTAPVYPSRGTMHRWMREHGLSPRPDLMRELHDEDCLIADKVGSAAHSASKR